MGGRRNPIKSDIVKRHTHTQVSKGTDGQALPSMKMYGIMALTYLITNTLGHDSFYYSRIKKGEILDKKMSH